MLNGGKAVRDKDGKIIEAAAFQSKEALPGRIQPDRRWFGNTRVISQTALDHFRTALSQHKDDPYSVLLKRNKLPMGLLQDESKTDGKKVHIVETEPFSNTFGPKAQRKRPRLDVGSIEELGENSVVADPTLGVALNTEEEMHDAYHPTRSLASEPIYAKGTSRRIWGELYKVLDSSDVVIHVLDARDPLGTRCKPVVEYLRKEKAHKHLVYVLNKVDLVPTWVTVSICFVLLYIIPFQHHTPVKAMSALNYLRIWTVTRVEEQAPLRQCPTRASRFGELGPKSWRPFWTPMRGPGEVVRGTIELGSGPPSCMPRSDPLVWGHTSHHYSWFYLISF